jgi:hypothetical protein
MKFFNIAIISLLSLLAVACETLQLPGPATSESTLLLLPFTVDNRSQHGGGNLGFIYDYEIVSVDNSMEPINVAFARKMDGDVIVVDSLPPGNYKVTSIGVSTSGSGDFSYDDNRADLGIDFEMRAKAITILPFSLNIEMYNAIPGRGMSITYSEAIELVTDAQKTALLNRLREQKYFDQWTLQN